MAERPEWVPALMTLARAQRNFGELEMAVQTFGRVRGRSAGGVREASSGAPCPPPPPLSLVTARAPCAQAVDLEQNTAKRGGIQRERSEARGLLAELRRRAPGGEVGRCAVGAGAE